MKSLNAKRIAATAAGAAMLGAAFAGAATQVDEVGLSNYRWFSNGAPDFVVVVGRNSQDAVAAANLAAMVGNLAYRATPISVLGTDGLRCAGGAGGACTLDEASKRVSLEVTTPGISPQLAYLMTTMIEDNLDSNSFDTRNTTTSFTPGWTKTGSTLTETVGTFPRKVIGGDTPLLQNNAPVSGVRSLNIKQTEHVHVFAASQFDDPSDTVKAKNVRSQYKVAFVDPLPYCLDTTKTSTSVTDNCPESDRTERNRVEIWFLGERWIVTDMRISALGTVTGITLGKSDQYRSTMQLGETVTANNGVKVTLQDITPTGATGAFLYRASFKVERTDGTFTTETVNEGEEREVAGVVIRPNRIFPGVGNTNYAEVDVFSDKLALDDGQQVSGHGFWRATFAQTNNSNSPAIAELGLHDPTQGGSSPGELTPGESQLMIAGQPALTFNYLGLEETDYDTLSFIVDTSANTITTVNGSLSSRFLRIISGRSDAFKFTPGSAGTSNQVTETINTNSVLLALDSAGNISTVWAVGTSGSGLYQNVVSGGDMVNQSAFSSGLRYYYKPSEYAVIKTVNESATGEIYVLVPEVIQTTFTGTSVSIADGAAGNAGVWRLRWRAAANQFVQDAASTTIDSVFYNQSATDAVNAGQAFKPLYYSPRGSKLTGVSTTNVQLSYANRVVRAQYTLASAATGSTTGTVTREFAVGEVALDENGYKVTVRGITATAAGGAAGAGAVSGLDGLRPSVASADSVTPLNTAARPLVVADDAAGGYAKQVVVGGPNANSQASSVAASEFTAGNGMIKVVGDKVIVAGYDVADTADAANQLIAWLASKRAEITA